MKKELAREWVEALRSGEYRQLSGQLGRRDCDGTSYCCLGVLSTLGLNWDDAPIIEEKSVIEDKSETSKTMLVFASTDIDGRVNDIESSMLPSGFAYWLGWENEDDQAEYSFLFDENEKKKNDNYWEAWAGGLPPRANAPYDKRGAHVSLSLATLNDEGFTFDQIADVIAWAEGIDA